MRIFACGNEYDLVFGSKSLDVGSRNTKKDPKIFHSHLCYVYLVGCLPFPPSILLFFLLYLVCTSFYSPYFVICLFIYKSRFRSQTLAHCKCVQQGVFRLPRLLRFNGQRVYFWTAIAFQKKIRLSTRLECKCIFVCFPINDCWKVSPLFQWHPHHYHRIVLNPNDMVLALKSIS